MEVQREFKDRLFRFRFGNEKYIEDTLALYNALNNSHHTDTSLIEINTIDDVMYLSMKNDVSFIVDDMMCLWEHQSSVNPNMPLRGLFYYARLYDKYCAGNNMNLYKNKKTYIPTPQYIVFYNGKETWNKKELRLSDMFLNKDKEGCLECVAKVYNINKDKKLLDNCKPLMEYSTFIQLVQKYSDTLTLENAIEKAMDECIDNDCMAKFLKEHKAEVKGMLLTEYNEEQYRKDLIEEGLIQGISRTINALRLAGIPEPRVLELTKGQYPDVDESIILECMSK